MKILKLVKLLSFLFVLSLMVVSCSKEGSDVEIVKEGQIDPSETTTLNSLLTRSTSSTEGLDLDCFIILFPFDLVDEDGETYTIEDVEDFEDVFDENGETIIVDFVYPLDIEDEEGNTTSIENGEELGAAFANCLPNEWTENEFPAYLINLENSCLTLDYPVTVAKLDGTTETFDDEASFVAALAEEPLFFVFPLSLTNLEGESITVNDVDELLTALFDCNGLEIDSSIWGENSGFEYIGCYEISFPFSLILNDGTTVEVNDHMEYCDLLISGNVQGFAFPMTLIGEEGEVIVNSEEELDALISECFGFGGEIQGDLINLFIGAFEDPTGQFDACFEISFPMSAQEIDWEGNGLGEVEFNSFEDILALFENGPEVLYNVIYPVSVTLNSTEEVIVLENTSELIELLIGCQ